MYSGDLGAGGGAGPLRNTFVPPSASAFLLPALRLPLCRLAGPPCPVGDIAVLEGQRKLSP